MDISKIINENNIKLNIKAQTKGEVLVELVDLLYDDGIISSKESFITDVYKREEEGQTGLENHIAIPHGKSDAVLKTSLAIGRTTNDIPWETLDGKPVRCVILFAVRSVDKTTTHIKLMSKVASALADEQILKRLLTVEDPKDIIDLFSEKAWEL